MEHSGPSLRRLYTIIRVGSSELLAACIAGAARRRLHEDSAVKSPDVRLVWYAVVQACLRHKVRTLEVLLGVVVLSYLLTKAPRIRRQASLPIVRAASTPVKRRGTDEPPVPRLYLASCDNDRAKATERWRATQQWRRGNEMSIVLPLQRQPKYHDIKRVYPHYLHGKTRDGAIFMWERVGRLDTSALKR